MTDLLDINDPDWSAFKAGDPEYFLRVTGDYIRRYCGWSIYPNVTVTATKIQVGSQGIIQLPTLYLTDVSAVSIRANGNYPANVLDADRYEWFQHGVIKPTGQAFYGSNWYRGYYYEPGPFLLPTNAGGLADVTFTHGYDELPGDIKQVAYEMATSSMFLKAGNVKDVASPGFKLTSSTDAGLVLNPEQRNRLAPYRLPVVI
jgi:hypothetical protein